MAIYIREMVDKMKSQQETGHMQKDAGIFYSEEKIALFIDGANLFASTRALGFDIDYKKLLLWASKRGRLVRAFYYTALFEDQEFSPIRPLVDWLDYNGFTMTTKPAREYTDSQGRRKVKGSIDVELTVDMLEITSSVDHIILFSGDGDFRKLIEAAQRKGIRVTVIGTISTQPSMVADELRRQADQFIDLKDLATYIQRLGGSPQTKLSDATLYEEEEDDYALPEYIRS